MISSPSFIRGRSPSIVSTRSFSRRYVGMMIESVAFGPASNSTSGTQLERRFPLAARERSHVSKNRIDVARRPVTDELGSATEVRHAILHVLETLGVGLLVRNRPDFDLGVHQSPNLLRQLHDRDPLVVTEVDHLSAESRAVEQGVERRNDVEYMSEATGLVPVAVDRDRPTVNRLLNETR